MESSLDLCPKCGGEVHENRCLDCQIDLEGWYANTPSLMPETHKWINELGVPMYEKLDKDDE
jgi:hypothetical protein